MRLACQFGNLRKIVLALVAAYPFSRTLTLMVARELNAPDRLCNFGSKGKLLHLR